MSWSTFIARATAVLTAIFVLACGYAALGQGTEFDGLLAQYRQLISSGQHGPAAEVAKRAQAFARDRFGTGSVQYAQTLDLLGDAYFDQHKYAEAEQAYRDALVIHRKRLGSDNPENIIYLSQVILCVVRQNNRGANKTSEFEQLANELHRMLEGGKIPSTGIVAMGLMETGRALHEFRLYEQAIYFLERAQHLYRSFNPTHPPSLLMATHTLGLSHRQMGNLADAERQLKDALAIADSIGDADGKARAESDLANVLMQQDRKDEAIRLYEAALRTSGGSLGKTGRNLAMLYAEQGRFVEAEKLVRDEMRQLETASPRDVQEIAEARANLIVVLTLGGKPNDAIPLIEENVRHAQRTGDATFLMVSRMALASAYNDTERHDAALTLLRQVRADEPAIRAKGFERLFETFKSIIAQEFLAAGSATEAYDVAREALVSAATRYKSLVPDTRSAEKIRGAQTKASIAGTDTLVAAAYALAAREPTRDRQLMSDAFEAAQWSTIGDAGLALAQLSARAAGPNAELSNRARELQELTATWRQLDQRLLEVRGGTSVSNDLVSEIARLSREISETETKLNTVAQTISQQFPGYWALARPQPITMAKVQAQLKDDEVLVLFDVQHARTLAWAVTRDQEPRWLRIDVSKSQLEEAVQTLRCGADESLWQPGSAVKCSKLVGQDPIKEQVGQANVTVLPFDLDRAHKLYKSLLAPFADQLRTPDGRPRQIRTRCLGCIDQSALQHAGGRGPTRPDPVGACRLSRDRLVRH